VFRFSIAAVTTIGSHLLNGCNINCHMIPAFIRLNNGWNAEPNAPDESVRVYGQDVLLQFEINAFQIQEFNECEMGALRFVNYSRYRPGRTNDEGWYQGQYRFSGLAPAWGEFYAIIGDPNSTDGPADWFVVQRPLAQERRKVNTKVVRRILIRMSSR